MSLLKDPRVRALAAAALWVALAASMAVKSRAQGADDFFITYRYADNLVRGQGFVFNPGERVFGTTAPGLGLLLAGLAFVTRLPVPVLGSGLTALALVTVAVLVRRGAARRGHELEGVLAGTLFVPATGFWILQGCETVIAPAVLLCAAAGAARWPVSAGVVAGFAVWCRPETALGVALLALILWLERRRLPWRFALGAAAMIAFGLLAAWLWFGSPLPETLGVKRQHAAVYSGFLSSGWSFWQGALDQAAGYWSGRGTRLLAGTGLVGLALLYRRGDRVTALLALYTVGLLVAYPLLRVPTSPWYVLPVALALLAGFGFVAGGAARLAMGLAPARRWAPALGAVVVVALMLPALNAATAVHPDGFRKLGVDSRYELYRATGLWLRDHTPRRAAVTFVEIGTIGYFSRRSVQDPQGLVTRAARPFLARNDMAGLFRAHPTEIVLYTPGLDPFVRPILALPLFRRAYRQVHEVRLPGATDGVVVYRRRKVDTGRPPG